MKFTVLAQLRDKGNPVTLVVPTGHERLYTGIFNRAKINLHG